MSYERIAAGGLGWSELTWLGTPQVSAHRFGLCSDSSKNRQICFIDNDPVEQATAERAGCVRSRRPWYQPESITACRTQPANNPGHVWCCPENAPQPITTTPEQRSRDRELLLAEQRAQQEGRLPTTPTAPAEISKEPTIDPGRTEPVSQQQVTETTMAKLRRGLEQNPGLIGVGVLAVGVGGYIAFDYFKRKRVRRMAALARVR